MKPPPPKRRPRDDRSSGPRATCRLHLAEDVIVLHGQYRGCPLCRCTQNCAGVEAKP